MLFLYMQMHVSLKDDFLRKKIRTVNIAMKFWGKKDVFDIYLSVFYPPAILFHSQLENVNVCFRHYCPMLLKSCAM